MKDLLSNYSIQDILIFIVFLAIGIKGIVSWMEWAETKIKNKVKKSDKIEELQQQITKIQEVQMTICSQVEVITKNIQDLKDSDRDDIKAFITRQHHYFCYTLGYIDDYNLDCIEKRYKHYKNEGGNSFIGQLMDEIRALPKANGAQLYSNKK